MVLHQWFGVNMGLSDEYQILMELKLENVAIANALQFMAASPFPL